MDSIQRRKFLRKKTLIPGTIVISGDNISVEIDSLSGNGATLLILDFSKKIPEQFLLNFSFAGRSFKLNVSTVWEKRENKSLNIGVRFEIDSKSRDFIVENILCGLIIK